MPAEQCRRYSSWGLILYYSLAPQHYTCISIGEFVSRLQAHSTSLSQYIHDRSFPVNHSLHHKSLSPLPRRHHKSLSGIDCVATTSKLLIQMYYILPWDLNLLKLSCWFIYFNYKGQAYLFHAIEVYRNFNTISTVGKNEESKVNMQKMTINNLPFNEVTTLEIQIPRKSRSYLHHCHMFFTPSPP